MIFIIFLNVNYLAVYYSLYIVNVKSLTASCCEKKVDNCNAHCYLDKKMSEESDNAKGLTNEMKLKLSEFQITESSEDLTETKNQKFYNNNSLIYACQHLPEIEHPPQS